MEALRGVGVNMQFLTKLQTGMWDCLPTSHWPKEVPKSKSTLPRRVSVSLCLGGKGAKNNFTKK